MLLDEQIVAIEGAFAAAGIPHAFGGAQALAYYGSVRATFDIDVNVFVPVAEAGRVFDVLDSLGVAVHDPLLRERVARDGQVRLRWQGTPVDLFFAYDPLHQSSHARRRRVDFGGDFIHILGAEDLITYKVIFDREKDWRDIASIVYASDEPLDYDYVRRWLERIEGPRGRLLERFDRVVASRGRDLDA
ncbi:hypothetical protein MYXO_03872 [Myxococcaceae bacterium]|nr:hypothetical protein MYXO_03872 [Myxococcaceae bacterium]